MIYNADWVIVRSHAIISEYAYVCTASHDYNRKDFPIVTAPVELGAYSWICAKACILPGVKVGEGAVLGLGSVATKHLDPWTVYVGVPARPAKKRVRVIA
ncbi:LbetaH domain-containing protein [Candidatus Methylacidithermus pantelleriae]|uniref:Acetyltransferase n=1 Tax=Candidatus Methylacidithermus pantelleriae TaxID=2744239 RepID=A0A8J2FS80_9BACT|nr:hypothetical protein [Candidatus Methylacidithermus pantelleriae]CAF0694420.1 hypothetical protein MPNT_160047 [Candidatus Methylacidithermus pantelleriae]